MSVVSLGQSELLVSYEERNYLLQISWEGRDELGSYVTSSLERRFLFDEGGVGVGVEGWDCFIWLWGEGVSLDIYKCYDMYG